MGIPVFVKTYLHIETRPQLSITVGLAMQVRQAFVLKEDPQILYITPLFSDWRGSFWSPCLQSQKDLNNFPVADVVKEQFNVKLYCIFSLSIMGEQETCI